MATATELPSAAAGGMLPNNPGALLFAWGKRHKISVNGQTKAVLKFLEVRVYAPALSLAEFLETYAVLQELDPKGEELPDAVMTHWNRPADKGGYGWGSSAEQRLEWLCYYLLLLRVAADLGGDELALSQFCANLGAAGLPDPADVQAIIRELGGDQPVVAAATADTQAQHTTAALEKSAAAPLQQRRRQRQAAAPTSALVPGQRVSCARCNQVLLGKLLRVTPDQCYADFQSDAGELLENVGAQHFTVLDAVETPPEPVQLPIADRRVLRLPAAIYRQAADFLASPMPVANVPMGEILVSDEVVFTGGLRGVLAVTNGEPRPYVDAYLTPPDGASSLADVPPRDSIPGEYRFVLEDRMYIMAVASLRGEGTGDA